MGICIFHDNWYATTQQDTKICLMNPCLSNLKQATPYDVITFGQHWSKSGLSPDCTIPLPEPMLTDHQWGHLPISPETNRKYPPFPLLSYFSVCVPDMFVTSYSVTYCIYAPGKPGICFHYRCAVYDECKYSDTFWLAARTRLFVQYTISLWSLCKLIWRHWTYKMPVRYILSTVWVRLSIFSPLSTIQYVGLYVFSLPISLVMIERIYILCFIIIIKSEVWTITLCLGLGHETMVSAVCLSIFLWSRYLSLIWVYNFLTKATSP